jgi:hypothetical protein
LEKGFCVRSAACSEVRRFNIPGAGGADIGFLTRPKGPLAPFGPTPETDC